MNGLSMTPIVDADVLRIMGPIIGVVFFTAMIVAVFKIIKGPSILDRMMASDVLLATMMCGFGGYVAVTGRVDLLPVLLALSCLGFLGSVSVSRYVSRSETSAPVIGSTVFEDMAEAEEDAAAADSAIPRAGVAGGSTAAAGGGPAPMGDGPAPMGDGPVPMGEGPAPTGEGPGDGIVAAGAARDHHPGPAEDVPGPAVSGEEEPIHPISEATHRRSTGQGGDPSPDEHAGVEEAQAPSGQERRASAQGEPADELGEEEIIDEAVRDSAARNADAEIGIEPSSAAAADDSTERRAAENRPVEQPTTEQRTGEPSTAVQRTGEQRGTDHAVGPLFGDDEEGRS